MGTKATGAPPVVWSFPIPLIGNDSMGIVPAGAERISQQKNTLSPGWKHSMMCWWKSELIHQQGSPM